MKRRNWTIGIMKVCLASGILFLPLPMEKLYAATVPDIRAPGHWAPAVYQ